MNAALCQRIRSANLLESGGRVLQFFGLLVEASGPDVFLGERCEIRSHDGTTLPAEVVGIRDGRVLLMPYGETRGIRRGSSVIGSQQPVRVPVGPALLGRVIDAFGQPLDGGAPPVCDAHYDLFAEPRNPLTRPPIDEPLDTGVRCIDALLTLGRGQRLGIFAGSGVGKSTLLGMISRNVSADINVIALIGERGREVAEFIQHNLGSAGMARSIVVVATSDQSALKRSHAALAATAIAEYFSDQGSDVLLVMDSVTRFAMAQREIGLSVGEPPTARGYTPSVFAMLPRLLERAGTGPHGGSITALYTVLVEGDDMNEPIADHVRAIVDGHIVLSRKLAHEGHYPAIDVLQSVSRLAGALRSPAHNAMAQQAQRLLAAHANGRDLLDLGAYQAGANPELDQAIATMPALQDFLRQDRQERTAGPAAFDQLAAALEPTP